MNILLVDDEVVMVETIGRGLRSRGYHVLAALSGQQALDHLRHGDREIDLVTTDYLMPAMNGIQLLESIRKTHPNLPVLIMTAYAQTSLVIEALNKRCDSFIQKPFTLDQLTGEIERIKLNLIQNTRSSDLHRLLPKIVHQINNPLTAINGFAELIRTVQDRSQVDGYIDGILASVRHIGRINKEIMNAGRKEESPLAPVDLEALLDACLEMHSGLFIIKGVQVERTTALHGLQVLGDAFGLEQAFKNLILNALDAMDDRPEKTLKLSARSMADSSSIEVAIEDTGCGIREELLNRIFEPYYTDKPDGNGLGLAVIRNVVEKHGGKVSVESSMGVGTKFTVHLPAMQMH